VFGILPPLALILIFLLWALAVVLLAFATGIIVPHHMGPLKVPGWFIRMGTGWMLASNFIIGPALAWALVQLAQRQRLSLAWPVLTTALFLALGPRALFNTTAHNIGIGITSILPIFPRALGGAVPIHWPTFLGQALLLCLPLAWLAQRRSKATS
jgi:hypothetical protein